jgi:hypothetical protein
MEMDIDAPPGPVAGAAPSSRVLKINWRDIGTFNPFKCPWTNDTHIVMGAAGLVIGFVMLLGFAFLFVLFACRGCPGREGLETDERKDGGKTVCEWYFPNGTFAKEKRYSSAPLRVGCRNVVLIVVLVIVPLAVAAWWYCGVGVLVTMACYEFTSGMPYWFIVIAAFVSIPLFLMVCPFACILACLMKHEKPGATGAPPHATEKDGDCII